MNINKIEASFNDYLDSPPKGARLDDLRRASNLLEAEIAAGKVSDKTVAEYEYTAAKAGFYAGYMAAMSRKAD